MESHLRLPQVEMAGSMFNDDDFLVSQFSGQVRAKLRALLQGYPDEMVEEAYLETFLRAQKHFRDGKGLDKPAALPGFVLRVCHNVALEFLRAHRSRFPTVPARPPEVELAQTAPRAEPPSPGAVRDQDQDAWMFLMNRFSGPVRSKLRVLLARRPELVEDACQETFLRVLRYYRDGKVLDPASLPGFVHGVCRNVALEYLRASGQRESPENREDQENVEPTE